MDALKNFAIATVSTGYDDDDTSVVLTTGHGSKFPTSPFYCVWWNSTDYPNPADDPNVEIVRVTNRSTDTLTITRAQDGTSASAKNAVGKTYKMMQSVTAALLMQCAAAGAIASSGLTTSTGRLLGRTGAGTGSIEEVEVAEGLLLSGGKIRAAREALTAHRTYYVATTGDDSNDGLSAGAPFLTIQKAMDVAAALDTVIYNVTIQLANGTYAQPLNARLLVGAGTLTVQGNAADAFAVIVRGTSANATVTASAGAFLTLKDLKLEGNASGYALVTAQLNGIIDISNVVLGIVAAGQPQITAQRCGIIRAIGNYAITAGGLAHVMLWGQGVYDCRYKTITVSGTPAFSSGFATASEGSLMMFNGSTFSGAATGKRYDIVTNAVIQTAGAGVNLLPGNSAGTTATGGQYA